MPTTAVEQGATLVEFTDYECPACRAAHFELYPMISRLSREFRERFRYVVKDYPLDQSCNEFVSGNLHPSACMAAVVVRLARASGRAEPVANWIWSNQASLSAETLWGAADKFAGVSNGMAHYQTVLADVITDIKVGHSLGVRGTPSFYLNGVQLPRLPAAQLEQAILYELSVARTSSNESR